MDYHDKTAFYLAMTVSSFIIAGRKQSSSILQRSKKQLNPFKDIL